MTEHQHPLQVVIGGSGPAAIEAALVLRRLADGLVATTIVTPDEDCVHLPMTVLAPFADFDQVMEAVPRILASGLVPSILEYIDTMTRAARVRKCIRRMIY